MHWLICSKQKITKNWQIHQEKWGPAPSHSYPPQLQWSHNNTLGGVHHRKLSRQHGQKLKLKKKKRRKIGFRQGQHRRLSYGAVRGIRAGARCSLFLPLSGCWTNMVTTPWTWEAGQKARWLNTEFLVPLGDFSQWCKFIPEQSTVALLSIRKKYILKVGGFFKCWLAKLREVGKRTKPDFSVRKPKGSRTEKSVGRVTALSWAPLG